MLEADTVSGSSSAAVITIRLIQASSLGDRERSGDEPAEGVGPHRSCRERDFAVGELVAERCDGVEGVVSEFVFADGVVEDLCACQ